MKNVRSLQAHHVIGMNERLSEKDNGSMMIRVTITLYYCQINKTIWVNNKTELNLFLWMCHVRQSLLVMICVT